MNTDKNIFNKIFATELNKILKGLYIMTKWFLLLKYKDDSTYKNPSM